MKRPAVKNQGPSAYVVFRRGFGRFIEILELYSARFFSSERSPFGLTGALPLGLLTISLVTGVIMLFWYVPSPDRASAALTHLTHEVRFGSLLRATHRVSAELLVIALLIHMIRMWATGRHRGPRARTWVLGLCGLLFVGLIGWTGHILPWDERAMVFLAWGKKLLEAPNTWPIIGWFGIGDILSYPLFSAGNGSDLLLRVFALHIGAALLMVWMVSWHLRRITPPRIRLPIPAWAVLILFVVFVAAMLPVESEQFRPFNPFASPSTVAVDVFITFPLLFYPLLGPSLLAAIIALVWIGLALLPRIEPQKPIVACVQATACVGCRLCLQDCPYGAIEMIPHPDAERRLNGREIARVLNKHCNACGVCVGSCGFDAIELPGLTSVEVVSRIKWILETKELQTDEIDVQGGVE